MTEKEVSLKTSSFETNNTRNSTITTPPMAAHVGLSHCSDCDVNCIAGIVMPIHCLESMFNLG